ncbi:hypothetical protein FRX31_015708 [Thalictrum thalictroides]|uniref:DUF4283 domain-containing protein n=1 Tax=Thalictrum thalictroides TaxID=46969 RepID=A0A7J6WCJ4_THATH|nr:hypothetical protein FRX31_015708 [Thalictrum thalictroides]
MVFGQADMTGVETGEAIVFMKSEKEAYQLAGMTPLFVEGIKISFRRWTPEFNSVPEEKYNTDLLKVYLIGIPLHLKKKPIIEDLMRKVGLSVEVDEQSLSITKSSALVRVIKPDWENIPRILYMEERGYLYKICLEIETEESLILNLPEKSGEEETVWSEKGENCRHLDTDLLYESNGRVPGNHFTVMQQRAWDQSVQKVRDRQMAGEEWKTWRQKKRE